MNASDPIHAALQDFAAAVTAKMTQVTAGEPEDQVRGPFETFMEAAARAFGWEVVCTGETPLPDRLGRPDYAVHRNQLLAGYVELKAPGIGAAATRFRGRNREQFKRFSATPNILFTDGNEWALYRNGELGGMVVRLSGDVATDSGEAVLPRDAHDVESILRDFLLWEPTIPISRNGKIDLLPGSGPLPNGRLGRRSASTPARRSTLGRLDDLATVTTSMRVAAFVYGIAGPRSLRSGADVEEAFWYPLGDLLDSHGRRCGSSSTAAPGTAGRASTCGRPAVPSCGG